MELLPSLPSVTPKRPEPTGKTGGIPKIRQRQTELPGLTVVDTSTIDLSYSAGILSASVIPGGISHNTLAGLTSGDPHTQYIFLSPTTSTRNIITPTADRTALTLKAFSVQTVDIWQVVNSAGTVGARVTSTLRFSNPGTGSGIQNEMFGASAGLVSTGSYNSLFGFSAGSALTSGNQNSLFGAFAGSSITTGASNICIGESAGAGITSGGNNTIIGTEAAQLLTTANSNIAIGFKAGAKVTTGGNNVLIATNAAPNLTTGTENSINGANAANNLSTGSYNSAYGANALYSQTTSNFNTGIGHSSGYYNTTGINNTYLGFQCAGSGRGPSTNNLNYVTCLGMEAEPFASNDAAFSPYANRILFEGNSTGTGASIKERGAINLSWIDSTNATRKAKVTFSAFDTAEREGFAIEASGSAAKIAFYGGTPVVRAAAIGQLTDSTGGTANNTVVAISGTGADADINNNFADLIAKINALEALLNSSTGINLSA